MRRAISEAGTRGLGRVVRFVARTLGEWTRPYTGASVLLGLVSDLTRSNAQLVLENALLRQQLIVAQRPPLAPRDRLRLVVLAWFVKHWQDAMLLVQPATVLRWYRAGFRLFWRRKTRSPSNVPRLAPDVVGLIMRIARENRLYVELNIFACGARSVSGVSY